MNIPFTISGLLKAGLTQRKIGDAIGRSQSAVSDMASGKIGVINPSHQIVTRLEALAVEHKVRTMPPPGQISRQPPATNRTLGTAPDRAAGADLGAPP